MKPLKERVKDREHRVAVNSGAEYDAAMLHGTDEAGNVLGNDGKTPVPGTAPGGFSKQEEQENRETPFDYSTLTTHADLDGERGLNGREKPAGWDGLKVAEKQVWLADNRSGSETPAGGWN